ncbi:hypothetical protein [Nocardia carnea]|uniref:hypothetical protein n=1 Tax=Nocardia carnea TaxID=37328 RepID=UPI002454E0BF|nr:hypothetical protein [Nocardia carnea]
MRAVEVAGTEPEIVYRAPGGRVWVTDSIAFAGPRQRGDILVTGSHGGTSAGEYAASFAVAMVVCNDAGIGKNRAGIAGLAAVAGQDIAGIAVSHDSARIGDGTDVWENGVVSYANDIARRDGVRVGAPLREQILVLLERRRT